MSRQLDILIVVMEIGGHSITQGGAPFFIAEVSGNHRGRIENAFAIMEAAVTAGANAIKLQTYTAETITLDHDGPEFLIHGGLWDGRRLYDLYDEAHTPWEWHGQLFEHGRKLGVPVFSSPFDDTAVDLLETLDVPAFKIASPEIVDLELIARVSSTGKPVIMSTGMATRSEIHQAINAARDAGCTKLALLHCNSGYPTPAGDVNLRTIPAYVAEFGCTVGFSDHTMGIGAAAAAVALGAPIIERHLTLSRADGGPDAGFSAEPDEFRAMVDACVAAHEALGVVRNRLTASEEPSRIVRPSIWVVRDIHKGDVITRADVDTLRPANGLPPRNLVDVVGAKATRDLTRGTPLRSGDVQGFGDTSEPHP